MSELMFYVAGIVREPDGSGFTVYFPDVPNVAAWGTTIDETLISAKECLDDALRSLAEKNQEIPTPSDISDIRAKVKAEREGDGFVYNEKDVLYQYFQAPNLDMVPVRINISVPKSVLQQIDEKARIAGMTRSGFMTMASREYTL